LTTPRGVLVMGKVRSKKSRWRHRPQPTGIPSVREAEELEEMEEEAKETPPPVLEKVISHVTGFTCSPSNHVPLDVHP